jgi:agmatine deiminase
MQIQNDSSAEIKIEKSVADKTAAMPAAPFRMPAEWEKHKATWLSWPHDTITFPDRVKKAEWAFIKIIQALHQSEQIELLVLDVPMQTRVQFLLLEDDVDMSRVNFHITDYADVWLRDTAPTFVVPAPGANSASTASNIINDATPATNSAAQLNAVQWQFNAWGNKFTDLLKDAVLPIKISEWAGAGLIHSNIIAEGGAIETNGQGIILTTEQCLLNPNRNPDKSKQEIEKELCEKLGANKVIWLKQGITNDHTDGHIDEVARFVSADTIICGYEDDEKDPNFSILKANYETLSAARDAQGKAFKIIKLPMPHFKYNDNTQAPASYTNFYIGNGLVLAAVFNDVNDQKAMDILAAAFPEHKIVAIDSTNLIYGGGAVHCITQQQPQI